MEPNDTAHDPALASAQFSGKYVQYHLWLMAIVLCMTIVMIPLLVIILPIVAITRSIEVKRLECSLTTKNLRVRRGVLNRVEQTVPLEKITDLAVHQNLLMRWMNLEAISVETAGQSSVGALVQLVAVDNAREFRDRVLSQRDLVMGVSDDMPARNTQAAPVSDAATLGEIRDVLLRIESLLQDQRHES
ncbi:MAG: PH domain-containing protein [Planctomycetota bacterium]